MKKTKIFLIVGMVLILGITLILGIGYYNYKQDIKYINTKLIQNNMKTNVEYTDNYSDFEDRGSSNPALRFRNKTTGNVAWYFDHDGKIVAYNISLDNNLNVVGNITANYTFLSYLGSLPNRVLKGWFIDLDVSQNATVSQNLTVGNKLEINNVNVGDWLYNQTYSGSTYNATYVIWSYNQSLWIISNFSNNWGNQTIYNLTYNSWAYNQSLSNTITQWLYNQSTFPLLVISDNNASWLSTYNISYQGLISNASYLSTYNATYVIWSYNQTLIGDNLYINMSSTSYFINENKLNLTIALYTSNLTASSNNTIYNETYNTWSYNQTLWIISNFSNNWGNQTIYNETYNTWLYNQTIASGWKKVGTNVVLGTSTDKVGIGTAYPNTTLHIVGNQTIIGNLSISQTLEVNGFLLSNYLYNQTATHFFYNMTASENQTIYNSTYNTWSYNQSLWIISNFSNNWGNQTIYNSTYDVLSNYNYNQSLWIISNFSGLWSNQTIYNSTYNIWSYNQSLSNTITQWLYNQTLLGDNLYINLNASSYFIVESQLNKTILSLSNNTIYNFTYHSFAYNQSLSSTITIWLYNQTIASGWNLSETNLFTGKTNYNVGIGTSSPSSLLHINGTGNLFKITNITNILIFVNETSTIINNSLDAQTMYGVSSQDLILALTFNNDSITNYNTFVYALDSSGTNSHGILGVNTTYNDSDSFNGGGGISMYAEAQRYINGTINAFHNVSVTMWAKIDPNSAGAGNYRRFFYLDTSGTDFTAYLHNTANDINVVGSVTCDTNYVPSTGVWHFYSFIHNGGNIKTYMDGELISSCSNNINGNLEGIYWIGSTVTGTAQYWNGSIDEVKIYSRALSQNEIRRLYYQRSEGLPSFVSQKYMTINNNILTISGIQRVGINTINPAQTVEINGSLNVSGNSGVIFGGTNRTNSGRVVWCDPSIDDTIDTGTECCGLYGMSCFSVLEVDTSIQVESCASDQAADTFMAMCSK